MSSSLEALTPPPYARLRVELEALTPLVLRGWLGSTLHGAIGHALRRHDRADSFDASPSYRRWMEANHPPLPPWLATGRVAPLVLRPPPVIAERRHLAAGHRFAVELVCLHRDPSSVTALCEALNRLPERGFGGKEQHVRVTSIRSDGLELLRDDRIVDVPIVERVATSAPSDEPNMLLVEARSPLSLRREGQLLDEPEPLDLALAALRRLLSLRYAFGGTPSELHLGDLAEELTHDVRVARSEWRRFRGDRWSSRQRKAHRVEGALGSATWVGRVGPLGELLRRSEPFGLGKGTGLGLGSFSLAMSST